MIKSNEYLICAHRIINEYFNLDRYNKEINDIIKKIEK